MADSRGKMRPHHSSRSPPFVLIGLFVVIAILAFNYWSASSSNNQILAEKDELQLKLRQTVSTLESHSTQIETLGKQIRDHKEENEKLREELNRLKDSQGKTLKDLEESSAALEQVKGELDNRQREINDCQSEKSQLEEQLNGCRSDLETQQKECENRENNVAQEKAVELDAQRLEVLKVVQRIWGNTAIMVLRTAGVNTEGIDESAVIENVQDLPNTKREQEQPQQQQQQQPEKEQPGGQPQPGLNEGQPDAQQPQQPEGQQPEGQKPEVQQPEVPQPDGGAVNQIEQNQQNPPEGK